MILFEIVLFALLLGIDIASKYIVTAMLDGGSKVIIPDILTFIYSENTGASFGMLSNVPWLLLAISIVASVGIVIFFIVSRKKIDKFLRIALIISLAGAIGNIYDRIVFGYVRDFIDYTFLKTWFNYNFAICNVADIYLTIGAIMIIIYMIFIYQEKPKVKTAYPTKKKKKRKNKKEPIEDSVIVSEDNSDYDLIGDSNFVDYDKKFNDVDIEELEKKHRVDEKPKAKEKKRK